MSAACPNTLFYFGYSQVIQNVVFGKILFYHSSAKYHCILEVTGSLFYFCKLLCILWKDVVILYRCTDNAIMSCLSLIKISTHSFMTEERSVKVVL